MRRIAMPKKVGEATITGKNRTSLPAAGMRELGWERGDQLIIEVLDENRMLLWRRPQTAQEWVAMFSGKLGHVFGDHEDTMLYLEQIRAGWEPAPGDGESQIPPEQSQ